MVYLITYGFWCVKLALLFSLLDQQKKVLVNADSSALGPNMDPTTSALCNVNLMDILPSPYQELSGATCSPAWPHFAFRFFQTPSNITTIVISGAYNGSGWIGIGFAKDGTTVNSSVMVGYIDPSSKPTAKQYYIDPYNHSLVTPDMGILLLTNAPPVVVLKDSTIYLGFQMRFRNRIYHKTVLLAQGNTNPVGNQLTMHTTAKSLIVEFAAAVSTTGVGNGKNLKTNHGILSIIAYGAIIPAGSIVARFFKHHDPLWYHIHFTVQYIGYVFALAGLAAGRILDEQLGHPAPQHRGLGIFVIVLTTLQVLAFVLRPHTDSTFQRYYHCYHIWVGRSILLLGAANIILGLQLGHACTAMKVTYFLLLAAYVITVIVLEIRSWKRAPRSIIDEPPVFKVELGDATKTGQPPSTL
ncbi:hypothetical protein SLE2022_086790 [Rubroshorea leprosula]